MSHPGLPHDALLYPCSDGQPMAETGLHRRCMVDVADTLELWFNRHGRDDVYVGSNNFLYYERGNPRAVVAPDVYVVVGASAGLRDTYLLWNEPKGPDFVLEVTSASTRHNDERRKRDVYASLGVSEYFLYDPRAEYLAPPLQGFRLHEGEYRAVPAVTVLSNRGVAVASGGAGAGAARRARGAEGATARPDDRRGPSFPPGAGARSRGGSRRTPGGGSPHPGAGKGPGGDSQARGVATAALRLGTAVLVPPDGLGGIRSGNVSARDPLFLPDRPRLRRRGVRPRDVIRDQVAQ